MMTCGSPVTIQVRQRTRSVTSFMRQCDTLNEEQLQISIVTNPFLCAEGLHTHPQIIICPLQCRNPRPRDVHKFERYLSRRLLIVEVEQSSEPRTALDRPPVHGQIR